MKILITGDEGFVGREFHRQLEARHFKHDIVGLDIKSGNDCRDFFRNDDLHDHYDLVIHLAAIVGGRQKIENQPLAVATDLSIDAEMFNWAARSKPTRVVYFSSSAAYPISRQSDRWADSHDYRLEESAVRLKNLIGEPDMSYGWSKLTGEFLVPYLEAEGVKVHVFRPFSGYGEDQDLDYPFPSFVFRGAKRQDPFVIWGDGEQSRDFIHIEDIVKGVFAAIDNEVYGPVNLCTGRKTTFNELAEIVTLTAGYNPEFHHVLDAPQGVYCRVGNPMKMLEFYTPKITLEEGVKRALNSPRYA